MAQTTTISTMERQTKDGRTLQYQMKVVQQPEKARACGAGAKSSADRRPVDPPPIVDLRIFELVPGEKSKDITFGYQANFFLYSTLEHARPINQGRVPLNAATLPVLTGTPVAGMAYLDRPEPAGYFIFPDLSVRHEGKYKLSFNLYEELKDPEKDADPGTRLDAKPTSNTGRSGTGPPRDFIHFRLEVKSNAFDVFSAKKFPGLSESTSLSRIVNEQGCRVRIRRDVRMRRRDKVPDGYKDPREDMPPATAELYHPMPPAPERPRSTSNASTEVASQYGSERRQSYHDINYYQTAAYQAAPQPQSASSYTSHLSFGAPQAPHYQTPAMVPHHQPPPGQVYHQHSSNYAYPPQNHTRQLSGPSGYSYSSPLPPQVPYGPSSYVDERPLLESRRSSGTYSVSRPQPALDSYDHGRANAQTASSSQMRSLTPLSTTPVNQTPPSLPPIKALVHPSPLESVTSDLKHAGPPASHQPSNAYPGPTYTSAAYTDRAPALPPSASSLAASQQKRAYGEVFDTTSMSQPMHSGMRPSAAIQSQDIPQIETADGDYAEVYPDMDDLAAPLIYKRADGSHRAKKCPSPRETYRYVGAERVH